MARAVWRSNDRGRAMQMRAMGPGAGWQWLMRGINVGRHDPRALFGAAALLTAVALVPSIVQLLVQNVLGMTGMNEMAVLVGFSLLYSLLVMPPLVGGFLRVIDAVENGRATHATAIFEMYGAGRGAPHMIGISLLLMLLVTLVMGAVLLTMGSGIGDWYLQLLAASQSAGAGKPPVLPAPPDGIGAVVALMMLLGLFLQGVYAIAFGQVALAQRPVLAALGDGLLGALKNLLPLLVLLVAAIVLAMATAVVVSLLVALLGFIGGLVHPALAVMLAAPVYVAFILILYVVMFGVMYHLWRDVASDDASAHSGRDDVVAA